MNDFSISTIALPIFIFFVFLFGLTFFHSAWQTYLLRKKLATTQISKIGFLKSGFAEVTGEILPDPNQPLLKSPLSKQDCVAYTLTIQERRKRAGDKRFHWQTLEFQKECLDFFVADETGKVLLKTNQANLKIEKINTYFNNEETQQLLKDIPIKTELQGLFGTRFLRLQESLLKPQSTAYVYGSVVHDPFQSYPNDLTIQRSKKERLFSIADHSEEKLSKNLLIQTLIQIAIGVAILAFSINFFIFNFFTFKNRSY